MTPKEKAIELFDKFNNPDKTNYPYIHNAQQCALIAVDEILLHEKNSHSVLDKATERWEQVKHEINNL